MTFLSRVLRLLFWLIVLSWGARLLKQLVAWMMRGANQPTPRERVDVPGASKVEALARRLVRDPVCGVHVAEVLAIPLRDGGVTLNFCSVNCRDEYARRRSLQQERLAANG
jgi:YHS domain-containing protein